MSREIKFRGLRVDGGGWFYGYYRVVNVIEGKKHLISDWFGNEVEVTTETVGQFTGLTDKNGNEIYDGDILEYYFSTFNRPEVQKVTFGWYYTDNDGRCHEYVMGWVDEDGFPIDTQENKYKIIGNIHNELI